MAKIFATIVVFAALLLAAPIIASGTPGSTQFFVAIGNAEGGNVGPLLTGIGSRKPREYLLESIVHPNAQIAPGFDTVLVLMKSGASYAGVFKSENDKELVLNSPEDGVVTISKADIKSRNRGASGMPDGMGPEGTKALARWPNESAPISMPGTILSQMPRYKAPSYISCERETAVAMAIRSRENSDSSMPGRPWVTPSHIAGTPPATWAVAPRRRAMVRMRSG